MKILSSGNILLEVCTPSVASALIAQDAGAYRVELCTNLKEGGTTPSAGEIRLCREKLQINLNVLIRPRPGDFVYSDLEFETIKEDIRFCGEIGCDGVVIGALNRDGSIDKKNCRELVELAHSYSMSVTFHRAFDESEGLFTSLEDVIDLGCERLLTSGGKTSAIEGIGTLSKLIDWADNRIVIMPGAGITAGNVQTLIEELRPQEIHGSFQGSIDNIRTVLRILK